jgi:hypothetical protein
MFYGVKVTVIHNVVYYKWQQPQVQLVYKLTTLILLQ